MVLAIAYCKLNYLQMTRNKERRITMSEEKTIYAKLEEELLNLALTEKQKNKLMKKLKLLRENKLNIMLVGATGCGKSSTINALFNCAEL